jgi:hypothetical protein
MKKFNVLILSLVGVISTGCATMFSGTTQAVHVNATSDGQLVLDAYCTLQNSRGSWNSMSPDTVVVRRDSNPLSVRCTSKDNKMVGTANIEPYYNTTNLWNIPLTLAWIVPGAVGWIVDGASGTTNEYQNTINVRMMTPVGGTMSTNNPNFYGTESKPIFKKM